VLSLMIALVLGQTTRVGELAVIEGESTFVNAVAGGLALDPKGVMARYVRDVGDVEGTLIVFTTFLDLSVGPPSYFETVFNDVKGTGMGPVDVRSEFGAARFEGFVDMRRFEDHPPALLQRQLAHEIAHRHLAHMNARLATATAAVTLIGRDMAHWSAGLSSRASIMGGYAWVETSTSHFTVGDAYQGLSPLDLYGLGLYSESEVPPFFFIAQLSTEDGFLLPPDAQLFVQDRAVGRRIDLTLADVVREEGSRVPSFEASPKQMRVAFALVTALREPATSTAVMATASRIEAARTALSATWADLTEGRGSICSTVRECTSAIDAGVRTSSTAGSNRAGCRCNDRSSGGPSHAMLALLLLATARIARGNSPRHRRDRKR
jgi:hypothetical protein